MAATRILVGEANDLIALTLEEQLKSLGYDVIAVAHTGAEAIDLAARLSPDLIIMDVRMPGVDGITATERINTQRPTPIVICTTYTDRDTIRRAAQAGVLGYLVKPVNEAELAPAIEIALARFRDMQVLRAQALEQEESLETRRLIERAGDILMQRLGLSEHDAYEQLRQRAHDKGAGIKDIAQAIVTPTLTYDGEVYPRSIVERDGVKYFLGVSRDGERQLGIVGAVGPADGFVGTARDGGMLLCPCSAENAAALRSRLPHLNPTPLDRRMSFGFGDRIGSATPGHIQALRANGDNWIGPIFAQQSVRENARTGRTPQQVLDDAMWGVFQEGWYGLWGADADHVKEVADLTPFVAAGYTFYTIDPSDHVDNAAQDDSPETLRRKVADLPWDALDSTYEALRARYCREPFALGDFDLAFDEVTLLRALAKYGRAIAHTAAIAAALTAQMAGAGYDLEVSVDETDTPTSTFEHFFIANELLARDIPVVSLAPRFVGKFQKGVDYMGDVDQFAAEFARHVAIMRHFDRYKLSVHTGSDKFSLYPIIARHAHGRVHVKTAGTSYLEALRLVAALDPASFRRMLDDARGHFEHDRKTYFLDAVLDKVPASDQLADADLPGLLDQFDARQVLHVAFGTILTTYGDAIRATLAAHEADYRAGLERHFVRHMAPFARR